MRPLLSLLALAALVPLPASAQTSPCTAYVDALRLHTAEPLAADASCGRQVVQALTLDLQAVEAAQPVAGIDAVLGTWLGDANALPFLGVMTPGQEVLEIRAGDDPATVILRQYWYKASLPPRGTGDDGAPFDADGHHTNLVAEAVLHLGADGSFRVDPVQPVIYPGARLQFRRVNELYILNLLNRFEGGGRFRRAGVQLVVQSDRLPSVDQILYPDVATFTQVAPGAPDTALLMVSTFEQSQTRYFDCLTHQISAEAGPLFDIIAPIDAATLAETLRSVARLAQERLALIARMRAADADQRAQMIDQFRALTEAYTAQAQSPLITSLGAAFVAETLGCPDPQDL